MAAAHYDVCWTRYSDTDCRYLTRHPEDKCTPRCQEVTVVQCPDKKPVPAPVKAASPPPPPAVPAARPLHPPLVGNTVPEVVLASVEPGPCLDTTGYLCTNQYR